MIVKLLAIVLPLGIDSFAIAAALGISRPPRREALRISLIFAAFEGGMPLLGLAAGQVLGSAIGDAGEWVAIAVLVGFGLFTALREEEGEEEAIRRLPVTHGLAVVALGAAVAIDELAIGFTLGLLDLPVVPVVVLIAVQAVLLSQLGLALGARISERAREGAERLAGVALALVGIVLAAAKAF